MKIVNMPLCQVLNSNKRLAFKEMLASISVEETSSEKIWQSAKLARSHRLIQTLLGNFSMLSLDKSGNLFKLEDQLQLTLS